MASTNWPSHSAKSDKSNETLFIVDWLLEADMQRRAHAGLNKGEAHHALMNALRIGRQGEMRCFTLKLPHLSS